MAYVLWYLGYPDQALKRIREALALAQKFSHPFNLAFILNGVVAVHVLRREAWAVQEWTEAVITLSTEQGFALLLALGTIVRGWALTEQGRGEEGIAQIRQGLVAHKASGAVMGRVLCLGLLAESCEKTGQAEEGLNALAEALDLVQRTRERRGEAKLYRLKGELSLRSEVRSPRSEVTNPQPLTPNPQEGAEACFLKAIEVTRRQQAKSLELRAVMSLSRLWQQQGKQQEAHQMLSEIYNWFTEGFDTKDLQEAKALLEELR
jgi:predicted ATPase